MTTPVRSLLPFASALALTALGLPAPGQAQALFQAADLDQTKFVIVAAPIGDGAKAQLNIYEQRTAVRPCYVVTGTNPGVVNPLLGTFDFTGICNRFIDANGYSVRIGNRDLATVYRLSVLRSGNDNTLMALPTKAGAGPEMGVARSNGQASGFLLLVPEPGWKLMRRQFGSRTLGHVYVYRDSLPDAAATPSSQPPAQPQPQAKAPTEPPKP